MRRLLLLAVLATLPAVAQTLTPGGPANTFQMAPYVSGLGQLTDFRFLPDGRVVMTEKTGAVKVRRTDGTVVDRRELHASTATARRACSGSRWIRSSRATASSTSTPRTVRARRTSTGC